MNYKEQLSALLSEKTGLEQSQLASMLEVPPDMAMGDFALPCFKLAKTMRKAPSMIAQEISASLSELPDWLERVEIAGGYLNFFLSRAQFVQNILQEVKSKQDRYGSSDEGQGRNIVLDYSSINIAKPFHIGHLSTTVIGSSLYKIFNFLGYNSVGVNHLGDWGTQFGKLITAYKRWGDHDTVEAGSIRALLDLYVKFHDEAEKEPSLEDEGRAWFKKIEDGDEEAMALFTWFKDLTLREVAKIYEILDVHFDSYAGESFYNDKMQPVIDELDAKGLLKDSDGAKVVDLEEHNMPPCLILKSDGATLYATRDLACAFYRKKTYDFYKNLYVVAYQQNLHFKQWFKVVEMMGHEWAKDMEHVAFGMVSMADGTLSTRKGRVIFLEDVIKSVIEKSRSLIEEKNAGLENKDQTAQDIGVGALIYSTLSNSRIKDIVFDLDRILNFDGETGPYVQYTHARALSVLRKAADQPAAQPDYSALTCPQAFAVIKLISEFPDVIRRAADKYEPFFITRHVTALAQAFNKFYYDIRILDNDANATAARLELVQAAALVIRIGLGLLGIHAPERM
ncbi:MAG: arginine--tRNA ligase [Clostridia bacterium]|nr:arginine--tRNA ligase [Clostridia bacterium]